MTAKIINLKTVRIHKWVVFIFFPVLIGINTSFGQTSKSLNLMVQSGLSSHYLGNSLSVYYPLNIKKRLNQDKPNSFISSNIYIAIPINNSFSQSIFSWPNIKFTHFFLRPKKREYQNFEGLYYSFTSFLVLKSERFPQPKSYSSNFLSVGLSQRITRRFYFNIGSEISLNHYFKSFSSLIITPLSSSYFKFCYVLPIKI